jgi:hypothetical protein
MGFAVNTFQLNSYAGLVRNHHEDAVPAAGYAERNLTAGPSAGEGVINLLTSSHEQVRSDVVAAMRRLAEVLGSCASALDASVKMYDSTDRGSAEQLDSTYPNPGDPPKLPPLPGGIDQGGTMSVVWQARFPAGRLAEPGKPEDFQNPIQILNDLTNLLSPGWWIAQILKETIGVNPVEELAKVVTGDWEAIAKCASTFNSLSFFCEDVAYDLRINLGALLETWHGNAANGAFQYFGALGTTIDGHQQALGGLRDRYLEAAKGVWEMAETAGDLIQGIFDWAFWAAVEVAAGGVLVETGVGPAVLWSLAALQCAAIVRDWKAVTDLIMKAQNLVRGIHGEILNLIGSNGAFKAHPVPSDGYHNPGVR